MAQGEGYSWQLNGDQRHTSSGNGAFHSTDLLTGVKTQWPSEQSCEVSSPGSLESFNDNQYSVTVVLPIQHKCINILTAPPGSDPYQRNYDNMTQNQPVGIEVLEWLNGQFLILNKKIQNSLDGLK